MVMVTIYPFVEPAVPKVKSLKCFIVLDLRSL